jgi:hypothetical protein
MPSLDDWEKEWDKNFQRSVQPKLLPVNFGLPCVQSLAAQFRACGPASNSSA